MPSAAAAVIAAPALASANTAPALASSARSSPRSAIGRATRAGVVAAAVMPATILPGCVSQYGMARRVQLAIATIGVAVASVAIAQVGGQHHILHEDLPGPGGDHPTPLIGDTGSGNNPTAIVAGDKVLPPPPLDAKPDAKGEPVLGKGGFAADRETKMKPDENTGPDQTLHYVSVFNPDVLPFKRMSAFDAVAEDETLVIGRTVLHDLPIGGTTDKMRDRFWGSVAIELHPGVDVPLPSVAPDMRILSYEVKPAVTLRFEKDGADNFYVRSDDSRAGGEYRLVFLCDADAGYFAPSLPHEAVHRAPGRRGARRLSLESPRCRRACSLGAR